MRDRDLYGAGPRGRGQVIVAREVHLLAGGGNDPPWVSAARSDLPAA